MTGDDRRRRWRHRWRYALEDLRVAHQQAAGLDLAGLSGWSVAGRYPGNLPDVTSEDAEKAVAVVATIVELAREDLRTGSPDESSSG
jgi:hypothetical protein